MSHENRIYELWNQDISYLTTFLVSGRVFEDYDICHTINSKFEKAEKVRIELIMNQHFVPKCYLKGFSDSQGNLWAYNLKNLEKGWKEKPYPTNIGKICYLKNYYEIPKTDYPSTIRFDNDRQGYIESEILGTNETNYPSIKNKFISGDKLSGDDYTFLADFIIQLKIRNPVWQKTLIQKSPGWLESSSIKTMLKLEANSRYKDISEPIRSLLTDHVFSQFINDPEFTDKLRLHSLTERNKMDNPNNATVRNALLDACWTMLDVQEFGKLYFITSDNPGFSIDNNGVVLNTKFRGDFSFLLPLTSKHCLNISSAGIASQKPSQGYLSINRRQIEDEEILMINKAACLEINKMVLSEREFELRSFLQKS